MSFLTLRFILFLGITACIYYLLPAKKYQWVVLLAASYVFYAFTGIQYAAYILITTLTSYLAACKIDDINIACRSALKENKQIWDKDQKRAHKQKCTRITRRIMILTLVFNFGILFVLKYAGAFAETMGNRFGFSTATLRVILPLGISFYTFQAMGYVVDVFRGEISAERNFGKLALFVSFFPQLLQGPISRYSQLAEQLYAEHHADFTRIKHSLELALWGLFKKLVIADRAVIAIQTVTGAPDSFSGTTLGFTVVLYALQLYADFSGGIDIARAAAQLLGIDMIQNFRQPYFATTLTDYWNRWHISLGAWMKNYVFYPIALSKAANNVTKSIKQSRFGASKVGAHVAVVLPGTIASLIVFLIVGIWHGAGWRYIIYGLWNGGVIMLSILLKPCFEKLNQLLHINTGSMEHHVFQVLRTFLLVCIGNITDLANNGVECFVWLWRIFTEQDYFTGRTEILEKLGLTVQDYNLLLFCTLLFFAVGLIREHNPQFPLRELLDRRAFFVRWLLVFLGITAILIFGVYGPGYNAAEFAYMQF